MTLEAELRERFDTREERFAHGGWEASILLPRAADALIDEREFDADERLPYWADLWPSARALTRYLLENPPTESAAVELGAGVALPSLALAHLGLRVKATDWYDDALRFARANAERIGLDGLETGSLDWLRHREGERFPLVIAADVLYEIRNADALAEVLPRVVAEGGRALIADPGRVYERGFRNRMALARWRVSEVDRREELSDPATGAVSTVRIWELRPPG